MYIINKDINVLYYELTGSHDVISFKEHTTLDTTRYMLIKRPTEHINLYFGLLNHWVEFNDDTYCFVDLDKGYHIMFPRDCIEEYILQ
jgi:hypothetical protein